MPARIFGMLLLHVAPICIGSNRGMRLHPALDRHRIGMSAIATEINLCVDYKPKAHENLVLGAAPDGCACICSFGAFTQ